MHNNPFAHMAQALQRQQPPAPPPRAARGEGPTACMLRVQPQKVGL